MDKTATKITVTYDDGSVKELESGLVFCIKEVQDDGATVTAEKVALSNKDFFIIITAVIEFGMKIGMFDDMEVSDDEES